MFIDDKRPSGHSSIPRIDKNDVKVRTTVLEHRRLIIEINLARFMADGGLFFRCENAPAQAVSSVR